jgi:hypothetical protein
LPWRYLDERWEMKTAPPARMRIVDGRGLAGSMPERANNVKK